MTDLKALAEAAKAAGSSWYACADERFVASEAGHIGARTVAEVYDRRDRDFIAAATPASILALYAELDELAAELDDERHRSRGDWASQRDNDHLTIEMCQWKARAEAAEASLSEKEREVERVRTALAEYHAALKRRENGVAAGFRLIDTIESILTQEPTNAD